MVVVVGDAATDDDDQARSVSKVKKKGIDGWMFE